MHVLMKPLSLWEELHGDEYPIRNGQYRLSIIPRSSVNHHRKQSDLAPDTLPFLSTNNRDIMVMHLRDHDAAFVAVHSLSMAIAATFPRRPVLALFVLWDLNCVVGLAIVFLVHWLRSVVVIFARCAFVASL